MSAPTTILVLGAGGTTGRAVVARALEAGHAVRAVDVAAPEGLPPHPRLERHAADLLADAIDPLVQGADAVISAVGVGMSPQSVVDPPPLHTEGTLRLSQAMKRTGRRRLVVISASFAARRDVGPLWFRAASYPALARILDQMADMERILRATDGIDWTAVRPGWLLEAPFTGDYTVFEDVIPRGMLRTRHADLADFMLRCATTSDWIGRTPAIARREPLSYSGPHAVLDELRKALGLPARRARRPSPR